MTSPSGFWPDRLEGTYAFRSLLDSGAVVANGSDAPVEELDPLAGIAAGVLRSIDERPAWRPEEALTVEQALHATCVAPAWLSRDERRRGKLIPGYLADLVVLDRDPVTCEPEELRELAGRRDDGRRPLGAQPAALGLTLGPDPRELDDRRRRGGHVLHARPLAAGVVFGAAGEEVRRRQPARREASAVGAAADDRVHGLEPDAAHGLVGRLDHLRVPGDDLVHVPVLLFLDDVD